MPFKQHSKSDVKNKKTRFSKDGKRKLGTYVEFSDGDSVTLLNPSGKGAKYARELKDGVHLTNNGVVKTNEDGKNKRLSDNQRSWRAGYLQAQKDNAKAYNSKKGDK